MKYGLFAAFAFALVSMMSGMASAGVATGLSPATVAPGSSIVLKADWPGKCYRRCRAHGGTWRHCRNRCGWWR